MKKITYLLSLGALLFQSPTEATEFWKKYPTDVITPEELPTTYDYYGRSLAFMGYNLAMGSVDDYDGGQGKKGEICFLQFLDGEWTESKIPPIQNPVQAGKNDFGNALAYEEQTDILAVGAPAIGGIEGGRVYLYRYQEGSNTWTLIQTLSSPEGPALNHFGEAIAMDKNFLVVGSGKQNTPENIAFAGAVIVYRWNGNEYTHHSTVYAPLPYAQINHWFGRDVSIYATEFDTWLAVGAGGDSNPDNSGAYLFRRNGNSWDLTNYEQVPNAESYHAHKVALGGTDGMWWAIGAPQSGWLFEKSGAIKILRRNNNNQYVWSQYIDGYDLFEPYSRFGNAIEIEGENLITTIGSGDLLAAHFSLEGNSKWVLNSALRAGDNYYQSFGGNRSSLAIKGYCLAVGEGSDDKSLAFYNLKKIDQELVAKNDPQITVPDIIDQQGSQPLKGGKYDLFGFSVDLFEPEKINPYQGAIALVGAPGVDLQGTWDDVENGGAVYVYSKPQNLSPWTVKEWTQKMCLVSPKGKPHELFGYAVKIVEIPEGENFPSGCKLAFVGAPYGNEAGLDTGAVYVYFMWNIGEHVGAMYLETLLPSDDGYQFHHHTYFGSEIEAEIVDDKGFVLIGGPGRVDPGDEEGGPSTGYVWAYEIKGLGEDIPEMKYLQTLNPPGNQDGDLFGRSIALHQVRAHEAYPEEPTWMALIGAPGADTFGQQYIEDTGKAYLYQFDSQNNSWNAKTTINSNKSIFVNSDNPTPGDLFGFSVALETRTFFNENYNGEAAMLKMYVGAPGIDVHVNLDPYEEEKAENAGSVTEMEYSFLWGYVIRTNDYVLPVEEVPLEKDTFLTAQNNFVGFDIDLRKRGDGLDFLAVSAPTRTTDEKVFAGAVYLFDTRNPTLPAHAYNKISAERSSVLARFGYAVSLGIDHLFVGAPYYDDLGEIGSYGSDSGNVYSYDLNAMMDTREKGE